MIKSFSTQFVVCEPFKSLPDAPTGMFTSSVPALEGLRVMATSPTNHVLEGDHVFVKRPSPGTNWMINRILMNGVDECILVPVSEIILVSVSE